MIGKPIKSGIRAKAEQLIIEFTTDNGFFAKCHLEKLRNQVVIKEVLREWCYQPVYSHYDNKISGYQKINPKHIKPKPRPKPLPKPLKPTPSKPLPSKPMVKSKAKKQDIKPFDDVDKAYERVKNYINKKLKEKGKVIFSVNSSLKGKEHYFSSAVRELEKSWNDKGMTIVPHQAMKPKGSNKWVTIGYKLQRLSS